MSVLEIRVRELEASVEAHRAMLASEHERADLAIQQIIRIGQELGGEQFDQLLKGGRRLEDLPLAGLAGTIIGVVKSGTATGSSHLDGQSESNLGRQVDDLKKEVDSQTKRANDAENEIEKLKKQASAYEKTQEELRERIKELEAYIPSPALSEPAIDHSAWFDEWLRLGDYERDRVIVTFIGDTGYSRKAYISKELEKLLGLKTREPYELINKCELNGLIQSEKGPAAGNGRPSDVVLLTSLGEWAYTKLTGKSPRPNEYTALLKEHKSIHHISLILKTAQLFSSLGFDVVKDPTKIKIADNRYYPPDLVVKKGGETFYLEVETGGFPDRTSLPNKWENAFIAGGGRICVVTPTLSTMNASQSRVLNWAIRTGKKVKIYLTNHDALSKLKSGENPWVRIKQSGVA